MAEEQGLKLGKAEQLRLINRCWLESS